MAIPAPNYVQGKYTVAQRDELFDRIREYPEAAGGLVNQVPTLTAEGTIIWRQQSSGGGDGTANANIAVVEDTSTASQAHAVGDLLVFSGQLYRVTEAIDQGDTITPGTNVAPTTVADELNEKIDIPENSGTVGQVLTKTENGSEWADNTGGVTSFNSRTGTVVPQDGDYDADMVGAVPVVGKGINLLDNWYFPNPVNQRDGYVTKPTAQWYTAADTGLTNPLGEIGYWAKVLSTTSTYAVCTTPTGDTTFLVAIGDIVPGYTGAGYGIDRWLSNQGSYQLTADGLVSGADTLWTVQRFEADKIEIGQPYTISIVIDGKLLTKTDVIESTATTITVGSADDGSIALAYSAGWFFQIVTYKSQTIKPPKVEKGSTQTAYTNIGTDANPKWGPNDPAPNFAEELAKCQRYQVVYRTDDAMYRRFAFGMWINANSLDVVVHTPVELRANPLVVVNDIIIFNPGPAIATVTWGDSGARSGNAVYINCSSTDSYTAGTMAEICTNNVAGSYLLLDANL